jgi:glycosyltransferase involved in cell wall biosynthesis
MKILLVENCVRDFAKSRLDYLIFLAGKGYEVAACIPFSKVHVEVPFLVYRYSFTKPWLIYQAIKSFQPHWIHAFRLVPIGYCFFSKIPFVAHTTGLGLVFTRRFYWPLRPIIYLILLRARKIIVQNSDDYSCLSFLKRKLILIPGSGIELSRTEKQALLPPVFISAGRLLREKGFSNLIQAFQSYKALYPEAQLWIAGLKMPGHTHRICQCTLEKWIKIPGVTIHIDLEDINHLLQYASCYIHPGHYREGLPRTVMEALNYGIPVIATNIPGCRDIIVDGINGILIPPKNSKAMFSAMVKAAGLDFKKLSLMKYSKKCIYPQMERIYLLHG